MKPFLAILATLLAVPAAAQPFIIPLQKQRPAEAPPPPPSPVPVAPPQVEGSAATPAESASEAPSPGNAPAPGTAPPAAPR